MGEEDPPAVEAGAALGQRLDIQVALRGREGGAVGDEEIRPFRQAVEVVGPLGVPRVGDDAARDADPDRVRASSLAVPYGDRLDVERADGDGGAGAGHSWPELHVTHGKGDSSAGRGGRAGKERLRQHHDTGLHAGRTREYELLLTGRRKRVPQDEG